MDLVQFLRDRYDEDEAAIRDCLLSGESNVSTRDLMDVDAKRRIAEWHRQPTQVEFSNGTYRTMGCRCYDGWPCTTLRLLALPYADHPDYGPEWRP